MDTIGNMLTAILNAQRVGKLRVAVPYSKFSESLAKVLKEKGYIGSLRVQESAQPKLVLSLSYHEDSGIPKVSGLKRLSKPGSRHYVNKGGIPFSQSARGAIILSTPQGLMDDQTARKNGVGGELVCEIW